MAHKFDCVCHSIRSMFRVLGVYNFDARAKIRFFGKLKIPQFPSVISLTLTIIFDQQNNSNVYCQNWVSHWNFSRDKHFDFWHNHSPWFLLHSSMLLV